MQLIYNKTYNQNIHPNNLNAFIKYFINNDKCNSAVLILPTRKYVEFVRKMWIKKYFEKYQKALSKLHIYNLLDFATLVLNEIDEKTITCYSEPALLTMLEEAMLGLLKRKELEYYKRATQNILTKMFDVINGLRKEGITANGMKDELVTQKDISSAEKRFSDITKIYLEYEKILFENANNKTDEAGIYNKIIDKVHSNANDFSDLSKINLLNNLSFLDADSIIYFCDFTEFKLPEAKFVSLFNNSKTPTFVSIDYSKETGPVIDNLPLNIRRLVSNELNTNLIISKEEGIIGHIKKWLFNNDAKLHNDKLLNQINIYEAKDRIDEVKNIVRLAVYLNREHKINFSDMCICSRRSDIYSELFREYFSESGIAVNISDRYNLSAASPIVLIFSLLDLPNKRWRRGDIEKLIMFKEIENYFNLAARNDNIEYNLRTLIQVANNYRITGGVSKNNWFNAFERLEKIAPNEHIKNINIAKNTFIKLTNLLAFESKNNFNTYANKINDIINILKIKDKIFNDAKKIIKKNIANNNLSNNLSNENLINFDIRTFQLFEEMEKNAKALNEFNRLLNELNEIENDKEYKLKDFISKLKTAVDLSKYQINEKNNIGINITSIEQTRGIPYQVMILCGVVEGEFPITFKTYKFLGKELKNSEEIHNDNEKILLYRFLANNIELLESGKMRFHIFYPSAVNSIKTIRSTFIDEICDIINEKEVNKYIINLNDEKDFNPIWKNYITTNLEKNIKNLENDIKQNQHDKNNYLSTLINNKIDANNHKNIESELKNNVYSASQLETYSECGLKYFYKYILQLKGDDKTEDYVFSPLDLGNYYHKILYDFYKILKEKYQMTDINQNENLINELMNIADKHLKNYSDVELFRYEVMKIKNTLKNWFEKELEKQNNWEFASNEFELKFDSIELNELKISGSIDRVEIKEDSKEYIVADYKLSKSGIKNEKNVMDGKGLQLPLYLLALKKIDKYQDYTPVDGIYYVFNDNNNLVHKLTKKENISALLDTALSKAKEYKNNIEQLHFPLSADDIKICNYCDYHQFCRISGVREI